MKKVFLFFLLIILPIILFSQREVREVLRLVNDRGEIYTAILRSDLKKLQNPYSLPGFDQIRNDSIFLYLNKKNISFFQNNMKILHFPAPPSTRIRVEMSDDRQEVLGGNAYPTYPLYLEIMEYFRDSFPDVCSIDTIGYSANDRALLAARMSRTGNEPGDVPIAFYSSTIHGDETAGYVFMLMLIDHFLNGSNPEAQRILDEMIVIINPLANPDGTYHTSDSTVFGATRGNARGIDLNRNFPDPESGNHPDGNTWQPETKAMMRYMERFPPAISANFHSGAEVVNYPFDTWVRKHADDEWFHFISEEYALLARSLKPGYMSEFSNGVTNGYLWYEVDGGRQDYVTYFLRGRETTIELSDTKLLPEDELIPFWLANRASMINYLKQGTYGIHGKISDTLSLENIKAEVRVRNHDKLNSSVFSDSVTGNFFRYLKGGNYDLEIEAAGYRIARINNVNVSDYKRKQLLVKMIPRDMLPGINEITVGPNPFRQETTVFAGLKQADYLFFKIYDVFGNLIYDRFRYFTAGYHEHQISFSAAPGVYLLRITSSFEEEDFRIIKLE